MNGSPGKPSAGRSGRRRPPPKKGGRCRRPLLPTHTGGGGGGASGPLADGRELEDDGRKGDPEVAEMNSPRTFIILFFSWALLFEALPFGGSSYPPPYLPRAFPRILNDGGPRHPPITEGWAQFFWESGRKWGSFVSRTTHSWNILPSVCARTALLGSPPRTRPPPFIRRRPPLPLTPQPPPQEGSREEGVGGRGRKGGVPHAPHLTPPHPLWGRTMAAIVDRLLEVRVRSCRRP